MKIKKCFNKKKLYKKFNLERKLTLKKVCSILELDIPKQIKPTSRKEASIVTGDFKSIRKNCIYFNYNDKLSDSAIEKIKSNCLCVFSKYDIPNCKCIIIENPKYEILKVYNYLRNLTDVNVICVTGSVGKTSTKEMIEAVLNTKYKDEMVCSKGNANSIRRTCENISKLTKYDKVYLQEAGIGGSINKDMITRIALMTEPNITVYTNIRDSHIEWYGTREKLAEEKFKLSEHGKKDGLAIVNYDDPILMKKKFVQTKITYSLKNKKADFYASDIECNCNGTSFIMHDRKNNDSIIIKSKLIGEHHILNALVAYIVGKNLGVSNKKIKRGIEKYITSGIRQNLFSVGKYKVLADCYNSSYDAIKNIMQTFSLINTNENGRKFAVIGDVFELGDLSFEIHKNIGKMLSEFNIDQIIFCGNEIKASYEEYKKYKKNSIYFNIKKEMEEYITKSIKENDIILFKASNGMRFYNSINRIFGTNLEKKALLARKKFETIEESNFTIYKFQEFCFLKSYSGKDKNIKIPALIKETEVQNILSNCFYKKNIDSVELSNNIVRIDKNAFNGCRLKKITFGTHLKTISISAFKNCKNLTKIILNDGLISIKSKAFMNCVNLSEIFIPDSVVEIKEDAFLGCKNVEIICNKDSFANKYAIKNNIKYKLKK